MKSQIGKVLLKVVGQDCLDGTRSVPHVRDFPAYRSIAALVGRCLVLSALLSMVMISIASAGAPPVPKREGTKWRLADHHAFSSPWVSLLKDQTHRRKEQHLV